MLLSRIFNIPILITVETKLDKAVRMPWTVIIAATASDSAPLQFLPTYFFIKTIENKLNSRKLLFLSRFGLTM